MAERHRMIKYNRLWEYISTVNQQSLKLTNEEIEHIAGVPVDHSFLNSKKELTQYGWHVEKISLKEHTIEFKKDT